MGRESVEEDPGEDLACYGKKRDSSIVPTVCSIAFLVDGYNVRSGGRAVERRTVNRGDDGSIPPTAVSKLRQFRSPHIACVFRKRH